MPTDAPTAVAPAAALPAAAELPVHLTRFVGRGRELADLARLVATARLVTLTGAGGSGKTRLARETAAHAAPADRVAWVDLAPLGDAELLALTVATALHVPERADLTPLRAIVESIGETRTLLVLDNCEHLVEACAVLADALLRACPALTILATSREALGVASETAWLVPPLASAEAGQLFVERAQTALPSFALTPANAEAVNEICRRLDGIPLAIELAAARVRVLTPEQIAARLHDAFRLLSAGSRTALPRHRTLRATMEWSFGLLAAREQVLLRRLAIFAGGFTLDAAEAVCAGPPLDVDDILDGVSALVDKSLVVMDPGDGEARYRLLETVRQYGVERLAEADEGAAVAERHARHYLAVIETAMPLLVGGSQLPGLVERLTLENDNFRAAWTWALAEPSRAEVALRFVHATFWFWYAKGQFREARQVMTRALAVDWPVAPIVRARALCASALSGTAEGRYALSIAQYAEALPVVRAGAPASELATLLAKFGAATMMNGDLDGAIALLEESLVVARGLPPSDPGLIFARFWRGWAGYVRGELAFARALVQGNVDMARAHALPVTLGHSLAMLARIDAARGDVEASCRAMAESLDIETRLGDAWGTALALDVAAIVAERRGRAEDAARLLAAVDAHRERTSMSISGPAPADHAALQARLRDALGERTDALFAEGRALSTAEAVAMAFAEAARHTTELRAVTAPAAEAGVAAEGGAAPASPRVGGVSEPPRLRVAALGPLQVSVGDRRVDAAAWGSARPRELLVYLLLHPEGRTKEQVGLAFWPDASAAQLRNSFHVTLHRLRKALGGADWVTLAHERYRVDPALVASFDVAEFERDVAAARRALTRQQPGASALMEGALASFRGDLLDGEPVGDWHVEHRDRLQRLYVDALMTLGARLLAEERPEKAAEVYRRVLARDELHEDALQALMRCHVQLGERPQALRAYRRFADRLKAELETTPARETTRLFERVQQGAAV